MVEYNRYTNCIFKPLKGKYFGKKCFLSLLIPSTVRHLCSNNERDAFFRCVPSWGALFILEVLGERGYIPNSIHRSQRDLWSISP